VFQMENEPRGELLISTSSMEAQVWAITRKLQGVQISEESTCSINIQILMVIHSRTSKPKPVYEPSIVAMIVKSSKLGKEACSKFGTYVISLNSSINLHQ
jgi:hypothetical protein